MIQQITSLQNPLIKHLVKLRQNHDYRYEHQSLLVEGTKMVHEICKKIPPNKIFVYDEKMIPREIKPKEIYILNEEAMKKISGMQTPEGIVAEIPMPPSASLKGLNHILALDSINEPGNLGTLLRSALALGWAGAFLIGDCCDPYNEKAIRASRGAIFRIPIAQGSKKDLEKLIQENQLTPLLAEVRGQPIDEIDIPNRVLLIVGNEAHGASEEIKKLSHAVAIPMPETMESLNVAAAGAILMYALRHQKS